MTIHLLNYNNYFNRQVKRQGNWSTDYAQYLANLGALENPIDKVNFVPGDNVNTTLELQLPDDIGTPDYLLVVDPGLYGSDSTDIISRWFIIDAQRLRGAFWKLSLYRDTIADYFYQIQNDPMMVHRGMLSAEDQFIYRRQPGNFNQIKTNQRRLWDASGCGWITGYISREAASDGSKTIQIPARSASQQIPYSMTLSAFQSTFPGAWNNTTYEQTQLATQVYVAKYGINSLFGDGLYVKTHLGTGGNLAASSASAPQIIIDPLDIVGILNITTNEEFSSQIEKEKVFALAIRDRLSGQTTYLNALQTLIQNRRQIYDTSLYQQLTQLPETFVLYDQNTNNYWRVSKTFADSEYVDGAFLSNIEYDPQFTNIQTAYKNVFNNTFYQLVTTGGNEYTVQGTPYYTPQLGNIKLFTGRQGIRFEKTQITFNEPITTTIPAAAQRLHCQDQPFDIFTIPYYKVQHDRVRAQQDSDNNTYKLDPTIALALVHNIPSELGTTLYDVQILPYCPLQSSRYTEQGLGIKVGSKYGDTPIKQGDTTLGYISWVRNSTIGDVININLTTDGGSIANTAEGIKVAGTTTFARLVSPNYASMFQFNYIKNDGLKQIQWHMTLRPYNPWIKVVPVWRGLYARPSSLYDAQGLILGGDFSLAQPTDAWANYQLSHKNYLSVFDRELKSLEIQQRTGMLNATLGTGMGVIMGAAHGGIAGGAAAAITGVAGLGSKIVNNIEQVQQRKDMFALNIGQIKATPEGLARTAAQAANDTVVPTIQFWDAPETQSTALLRSIYYNGMTIERVDTLKTFVNNKVLFPKVMEEASGCFFQATPLKLSIQDDFHIANTIAQELSKGVYLT